MTVSWSLVGDDHLLQLPVIPALPPAAAARHQHDGVVPGLERVHPEWQPGPGLEGVGQVAGVVVLEVVDDDSEDDGEDDEGDQDVEEDRGGHGETEECEGEDEEHAGQVEDSEPSVLRGHVAEDPGHGDGPPHGRDRVEEKNPSQVEGEVDQSNLQR